MDFIRRAVLITVRGSSETIGCICFKVIVDGQLQRVAVETELLTECCFQRVLSFGKEWFVDPDPTMVAEAQAWRF